MNPYIVLSVQLLLSGCNYIISNAATQTIPPPNLTFLRTIISGTFYLLYVFYARLPFKYRGRDLTLLLFLSLISVSLNQFAFLYGMKYTTATEGAIFYSLTPTFVMLLSRKYLDEKITPAKVAGTVMAFLGVVIVVFSKGSFREDGFHLEFSHVKGDALIFVAVMAWATYTTLGRKLVIGYGAMNTTVFTALIGTVMFAPIGIGSSIGYDYLSLSGGQWMEVLYLSLGTSVAGYVLWYYALGKIEASKVAVFTNGQPVVTAILAYVFLRQGITALFALGAVITIAGVVITQLKTSKVKASA
jgi:drug/metabolite transporter (DMT)-like permease